MTSIIIPRQTDAWDLDPTILEVLPCVAFGTYQEIVEFDARCQSICQRPDNPCIVDVDFLLEGNGDYEIVPEYCMFSIDTTNGFDGTWHLLQPLETDALHFGRFLTVHGSVIARYVADFCDHISSFFSEPRICFRLTFREKQAVTGTFGAFEDPRNQVPDDPLPDPMKTPTGGCRQRFFGTRLPRA